MAANLGIMAVARHFRRKDVSHPFGRTQNASHYITSSQNRKPRSSAMPRMVPKICLVIPLTKRDICAAFRDWFVETDLYDLFLARPLAAASGFALRAQAT